MTGLVVRRIPVAALVIEGDVPEDVVAGMLDEARANPGLLDSQPIVVAEAAEGQYRVLAGRVRATVAVRLGIETITATTMTEPKPGMTAFDSNTVRMVRLIEKAASGKWVVERLDTGYRYEVPVARLTAIS